MGGIKTLILVLCVLLVAAAAGADVIADGSITVSGTAAGISTVPDDSAEMVVTVETGAVRVGMKTTPTGTAGHLLNPGDVMTVYGFHDIKAFKVIFNSGVSSATVRYSISK